MRNHIESHRGDNGAQVRAREEAERAKESPRATEPAEALARRRGYGAEPQVDMFIRVNGDPFELSEAVSITGLLAKLDIDPRRVAVEHNLIIVKRDAFDRTMVSEGDEVEIVNFVGGG